MERRTESGNRAAVVFDSGIGGLNLLYECARRAPHLRYYYISDTAHVPYGNRSAEEILSLTLAALKGVESLRPAALVVACNTVTAQCISALRSRYPFPVVGIQPAVKQAAEAGGRCLVLATKATVASKPFRSLVSLYAPTDTVTVGSESLANYIESNIFTLPQILPEGLLPKVKCDSVVLGCTHYAFIKGQIKNYYNCPVFDGISGTAAHFCDILGTDNHFYPPTGTNDHLDGKKPNISFIGGNNVKNKQIFESLFTIC